MDKLVDGALTVPPFKVTDPERIPVKRYYDEDFYQLETERLWPHVWQMAARVEQIAEKGDWIEYQNLGKSVLIVNTGNGIKAYHNACRHRGVPIAGGKDAASGNCAQTGFICPFHGWRWNADGENTFVYGRHLFSERQLDPADLHLRECRAEIAIGCVFINHDDNALSLRDTLGPLLERLEAHHLDKTRAEWCYATVLPANWKIAMEAFMEGYHVMQTHPQLERQTPHMYGSMYERPRGDMPQMADAELSLIENQRNQVESMQLLSEGMAGMIHQKEVEIARSMIGVTEGLPEDPNLAMLTWLGMVAHKIGTELKARGEPVADVCAVKQSHPINAVEFMFPHYFVLPSITSFSAYRIRPLGPESCYFEIWSLTTFPEGQEPDPVLEPTVLPYDSPDFPPIPRQDYSNIPIQQQGMHADGFEFMRLSKTMEGLISNYQRILDGHLAGVDPKVLAEATHKLGGNFDGPILDFPF